MNFSIIVATTECGGIGNKNRLPWNKLSKDIRFFKEITTFSEYGKKNVVIMGRKTWESIPEKFRPLSNRINIIISSKLELKVPECVFKAKDFKSMVDICKKLEKENKTDKFFIIGGSSVYKEAMENGVVDRIFLTKVLKEFECDAFFPIDLLKKSFILKDKNSDIIDDNDVKIQFFEYVKFSGK